MKVERKYHYVVKCSNCEDEDYYQSRYAAFFEQGIPCSKCGILGLRVATLEFLE